MGKKIYRSADSVVGNVGDPVEITTPLDISTYALAELEMIFIKPSGGTITRNPNEIKDKYTCVYYTCIGDLDEDGEWEVYLKDVRIGREFVKGNGSFTVRPKAMDMALYNG